MGYCPKNMGITQLLTIVKMGFSRILSLCSLAWVTSALTYSQDTSAQEEKQQLSLHQKPCTDHEELQEEMKQMQSLSTSSLVRLHKVEKQIEKLESDLCGEKEMWRTRYQELEKHQLALQQQLYECEQARCIHTGLERQESPTQYNDVTDGDVKLLEDVKKRLHRHLGSLVKSSVHDFDNTPPSDGCNSITRSLSRSSSIVTNSDGTIGGKSPKHLRVFTPRSALDLKNGSKVKVLLPSGRVGIGRVCNVGQVPSKVEFHVGVNLENSENWQHDRVFEGHRFFHGKSEAGVIVPFSKVLMAWE
ncbi:uncharacterized protein O3C94_002116 isoform 2-T2 [Discoglossus pictus]